MRGYSSDKKPVVYIHVYDNQDIGISIFVATIEEDFTWEEWFRKTPEARTAVNRATFAAKTDLDSDS